MKQILQYTLILISLLIQWDAFAQQTQIESNTLNYEQINQQHLSHQKAHIDSLRPTTKSYPVIGAMGDTLFQIYAKSGALTPSERAIRISQRIDQLSKNDFLAIDSIRIVNSENSLDIIYGEMIIINISEIDAVWANLSMNNFAMLLKNRIQESIRLSKRENQLSTLLLRVALAILVILMVWVIFLLIKKAIARLAKYINYKKDRWLKNLSYKDYTFLSAEQELQIIFTFIKATKWLIYGLFLYIALPTVFSIFPFSRNWANLLFNLIYSPFKSILSSIIDFIPNLITITVIYFIMRYFIKLVKYIFSEIKEQKLQISGFHADWAMPTYTIVRFLLYAFMFVLIFPYLPGSESNIFKGVSVFIGILFSLGSSSAIANMVAGLVITYMRPFKMGDRIKIGEVTGDVVEKNLLVTRIKTVKNEIVTIPNSSILSGNTTNFSSETENQGVIIHTTVTIGYDVPWKEMHQALIDAALRTDKILHEPNPFVLQTSLDDFYVAYQINGYIKEVKFTMPIRSQLHQNIQDVCNERGIEILSPHYRSARDGNATSIPANYLDKEYKAPAFNVRISKEE